MLVLQHEAFVLSLARVLLNTRSQGNNWIIINITVVTIVTRHVPGKSRYVWSKAQLAR